MEALTKGVRWLKAQDKSEHKVDVPEHEGFSFKKLFAFMGPGILISIAYIDPGNYISAGAAFNYRLIWVLVVATTLGLFLQILSSRLGIITGKDLATICRDEYGQRTPLTVSLWLITESAIIASDIPEIIGTAFALNMIFGLPLWAGVVITAVDTMIFLGLQYFGVRKLEIFSGALVGVISACFVIESAVSPISWASADCGSNDWCSNFPPLSNGTDICPTDYCGTFFGGFLPRIDQAGLYNAISLIGAVVMPHNLYLHSALVLSRKVKKTPEAIKEANLYNYIECFLALGVSCVINTFILAVAAANFFPNASNGYSLEYINPDLNDTEVLLGNFLGKGAKYVFAIALLAAGQSSTLTGTYAGQFVMQGFVEIKLPMWARNLITRSIAIIPSLVVAIVAGKQGSTNLIILSSAILSFQLPFALVPLLKFTSSKIKMGRFANSRIFIVLLSLVAFSVFISNVYLIYDLLFDGSSGYITTIDNSVLKATLSIITLLIGIAYVAFLLYLAYRPVTVEGYNEHYTPKLEEIEDDKPLLRKDLYVNE